MMTTATDVVQQLKEKKLSGMQSVLEKIVQEQAKIAKILKQILSSNVGIIACGGGKSNKQPVDPNKSKYKNCDRVHKHPDSECWKLPENKDKAPDW